MTATATAHVQQDIVRQLGMVDPHVTITGFARPNLRFEVIRTVNDQIKDTTLRHALREFEGSGVIYVATVKEAERMRRLSLATLAELPAAVAAERVVSAFVARVVDVCGDVGGALRRQQGAVVVGGRVGLRKHLFRHPGLQGPAGV